MMEMAEIKYKEKIIINKKEEFEVIKSEIQRLKGQEELILKQIE